LPDAIDRAGRIIWRGHPMSIDIGAEIDNLLEAPPGN
jgi:hypothetical protein